MVGFEISIEILIQNRKKHLPCKCFIHRLYVIISAKDILFIITAIQHYSNDPAFKIIRLGIYFKFSCGSAHLHRNCNSAGSHTAACKVRRIMVGNVRTRAGNLTQSVFNE